jgi:hypothetical protein
VIQFVPKLGKINLGSKQYSQIRAPNTIANQQIGLLLLMTNTKKNHVTGREENEQKN